MHLQVLLKRTLVYRVQLHLSCSLGRLHARQIARYFLLLTVRHVTQLTTLKHQWRTTFHLDLVELHNEVIEVRVQFVQQKVDLRLAVRTQQSEVLSFLLGDLKQEVAQVLHHLLVNILQRQHLGYRGNRFLRNLLRGLLQLLSCYIELFQDLMNKQREILHQHFILLEYVSLDQAKYLPQR